MDKHNRDLANRLFAVATMILEDAIVPTIAGQSPRLSDSACARHAYQLSGSVTDLAVLAQAAMVVERFSQKHLSKRQRRIGRVSSNSRTARR